ncbi:MAG: hypothetical protein GY861_25780 [bacterium]|nr:hypothetical protein [bacterium]
MKESKGISARNAFTIEAMTLRDYFAGQVIMGTSFTYEVDLAIAARKAYKLADAMLKERSK